MKSKIVYLKAYYILPISVSGNFDSNSSLASFVPETQKLDFLWDTSIMPILKYKEKTYKDGLENRIDLDTLEFIIFRGESQFWILLPRIMHPGIASLIYAVMFLFILSYPCCQAAQSLC